MANQKTILVTGCSDGSLGSALALALKDRGWRVFASARNPAKLKDTEKAGIESVLMDVGSEASIAATVEKVKSLTGGSLDGLVNNVGAGGSAPMMEVEIEHLNQLFDLNVNSIIRVTRGFLPLLLRSEKGALIANNTSGFSLLGVGFAFQGPYAAVKAAASSVTENFRQELAPFGIRVVNLVTGAIKTSFWDNAPKYELSPDSMYNLAKKEIEDGMNGVVGDFGPATTWAKQVAADLSARKPSYMIARGNGAGTARLATLLPLGTLDGIIKKHTAVDVLEQRIKEQGGLAKLKFME
jgi:NAD(P)-dependent dehydrogenase (short-subunit alcohol dehydrogenase family)